MSAHGTGTSWRTGSSPTNGSRPCTASIPSWPARARRSPTSPDPWIPRTKRGSRRRFRPPCRGKVVSIASTGCATPRARRAGSWPAARSISIRPARPCGFRASSWISPTGNRRTPSWRPSPRGSAPARPSFGSWRTPCRRWCGRRDRTASTITTMRAGTSSPACPPDRPTARAGPTCSIPRTSPERWSAGGDAWRPANPMRSNTG